MCVGLAVVGLRGQSDSAHRPQESATVQDGLTCFRHTSASDLLGTESIAPKALKKLGQKLLQSDPVVPPARSAFQHGCSQPH